MKVPIRVIEVEQDIVIHIFRDIGDGKTVTKVRNVRYAGGFGLQRILHMINLDE